MSFPFVTPSPITELDPDYEYALQERERVVYEMRRLFKKKEIRYMFWHAAPPGTVGLLLRDPIPPSFLPERLKEIKFEVQPEGTSGFKDFRSYSGNSIRVQVRLVSDEINQRSPGQLLLITTHIVL